MGSTCGPSSADLPDDRRRTFFADHPHGVFCLDLDGRFELVDATTEGLTGHAATDLVGRHATELLAPDEVEKVAVLFAAAASGTPRRTLTAIRRPSGERLELSVRLAPAVVDGQVVGIHGMAEDVTDLVGPEHLRRTQETADAVTARVAADDALRASEERHRLVAEVTREVIWDADLLSGRTTWTGAVRDVFGLPQDEVEIDLAWWRSRIHPDDVSHVIAAREAALTSTSDRFLDEYRLRDHAGRYVTLLAQGRILRDPRGTATRFVGSMLDVTDLRRQERELELARRVAEEADAAKSLFLANMSHELRTPLSIVIAGAELLRDTALTRPQHRLLDRVSHAGERLLRLVDDLLDLTAIERGDVRMRVAPLDLAALVEQAAAWAAVACQERHLDFRLTTGDLPRTLLGDADRIGQVLTNLIDNAVKFTSTGGVRMEVDAVDVAAGARVRFTVHDTGIGVDPAQQEDIFTSFQQADPSITRRYGGNGLGLAISKELVESMGGTIGVESAPGRGSSFSFEVLLAAPETATTEDEPR